VIYLRFAAHKELLRPSARIKRYELDAYAGFESFTTRVNNYHHRGGRRRLLCLRLPSDLLLAWALTL
jgi:hypothetical protein